MKLTAGTVGELLPVANETKNGFLSKELFKSVSRSQYVHGKTVYRILNLSNTRWTRYGFRLMIMSESGSISEYVNCSTIIDDGSVTCTTKRIIAGPGIKILKKDKEIYFHTEWISGTNYAAFIDSYFPIKDCGVLDGSYEEIPISDL